MLYEVGVVVVERRSFKASKRVLIDLFERSYLSHLLQRHGFNVAALVWASGLSRRHLCTLIRKHRLAAPL